MNEINYKGKDSIEKRFAEGLTKRGIEFQYEPIKWVWANPLVLTYSPYSNLRERTYEPDFYFEYKGRKIFVEVKGWMRKTDSIRHRLFHHYCVKNGFEFYVVVERGSIKNGTKDFYFTSIPDKNVKSRQGINYRLRHTFWVSANIL